MTKCQLSMMKPVILMQTIVTVLALMACAVQGSTYRRVCYFTSWSRWRRGIGHFSVQNVEPFLCTHIIFAFGTFDYNGNVAPFEPGYDTKDYAALDNLRKQNKDLKLLLALGGWNFGSTRFSNMASNPTLRSKFINSVVAFLRKYNFDGLDIDWEYPAARGGVPADKANLVTLCKELIDAFTIDAIKRGKDRLLLSAAVPANQKTAFEGYNIPALSKYFDFISIMTYDLHGGWDRKTGFNSPLYAGSHDPNPTFNMDSAARWWFKAGFPKHKINVGFATYGRSFTLTNPADNKVGAPASTGPAGPYTGGQGFWSYYEVCLEVEKGGRVVFDSEQKVPYYVKDSLWIGYDNERSFTLKANWLKYNGYGGVMFWALDLDDFDRSCTSSRRTYPLIKTVIDILGDDVPFRSTLPPPTTTKLYTTARPTTTTTTTSTTTTTTTRRTSLATTTRKPADTFTCPPHAFGTFPDLSNCSKFYMCIGGKTYSVSCPNRLVWDPIHSSCNFPFFVNVPYCHRQVR